MTASTTGTQFLSGMVAGIVEIVGEQAGQTLFRYTAREEGKRIALAAVDLELETLVAVAADLLSVGLKVVRADPSTVAVVAGPLPRGGDDPIQHVIVGLLEGFMMKRSQHKRFETTTTPGGGPDELAIEVKAVTS